MIVEENKVYITEGGDFVEVTHVTNLPWGIRGTWLTSPKRGTSDMWCSDTYKYSFDPDQTDWSLAKEVQKENYPECFL